MAIRAAAATQQGARWLHILKNKHLLNICLTGVHKPDGSNRTPQPNDSDSEIDEGGESNVTLSLSLWALTPVNQHPHTVDFERWFVHRNQAY